jgi:2-dehydro-3-deoxygluconokinase
MMDHEVLTFGETMISLRSNGLIRLGAGFSSSLGGAESNVAIGLSRLGHRVGWIGAVGEDEQGELVLRTLRAERVSIIARVDQSRPTALMLVEKRLGSSVRVSYYRSNSAGSSLRYEDVEQYLVPGVRLLHVTGITPALSASARDATLRAVNKAKELGITVSFDVNYRALLWQQSEASEVLSLLAAQADILIASESELPLIGSGSHEEIASHALSLGTSIVVIKRGALGVTVVDRDVKIDVPAHLVAVIDTVGAGDAFSAGFLSGFLDNLGNQACAERGVATAAFSAANAGDWEGLPTRKELAMLDLEPGETIR